MVIISYHLALDAAVREEEVSVGILPFDAKKNQNGVATRLRNKIDDMYNRFDRIPTYDRQTDILRRHSPRYVYASRGKNRTMCYSSDI